MHILNPNEIHFLHESINIRYFNSSSFCSTNCMTIESECSMILTSSTLAIWLSPGYWKWSWYLFIAWMQLFYSSCILLKTFFHDILDYLLYIFFIIITVFKLFFPVILFRKKCGQTYAFRKLPVTLIMFVNTWQSKSLLRKWFLLAIVND